LHEAKRRKSLDGLRGLAALTVFTHHVWGHQLGGKTTPPMTDFWSVVGTELRLGLFLFFILTGFLLYRGFVRHVHNGTRPDLSGYLRRRAARILPAYYVAVAAAIVIVALVDVRGLPPASQLPLFAVFAQNFSADTFLTVDSPTWTLCIELGFYLLLPLIVVGLLRLRAGWRFQAGVLAAMFAAGLVWRAIGNAIGGGIVWDNMLPAWLPYFALGMGVALWLEYGRPKPLTARQTGIVAAGAALLVVANGVLLGILQGNAVMHYVSNLPAGAGFAMLTGLAVVGTGFAVRWMHLRWLAGLGIVSYGFYLWHMPLLIALRAVYPHGGFIGTFAAALPVTLLAGALSWRLVEKPALQRARRTPEPRPEHDAARPERAPAPAVVATENAA
jgi:peptidoglycan/LPS O-acetylase OafA/YrhL